MADRETEQASKYEAEQPRDPAATMYADEPPARDDYQPRLNAEDQERVDGFLKRGVNSVERRPFRPLLLVIVLIVVVGGLSLFSQLLARWAGVY